MCLGAIGIVAEVGGSAELPYAVVDFGDRKSEVGIMTTEELRAGAAVLVHSGFILDVLDPERASELLATRARMADPDAA